MLLTTNPFLQPDAVAFYITSMNLHINLSISGNITYISTGTWDTGLSNNIMNI